MWVLCFMIALGIIVYIILLVGVSDGRRVVMVKHGSTWRKQTVTCSEEPSDLVPGALRVWGRGGGGGGYGIKLTVFVCELLWDWYSGVEVPSRSPDVLSRLDYKYYVCIDWSGLSAFSGALDSLQRCAGGVGEAGASYMNKRSSRTKELFLLFPSPDIRYTSTCMYDNKLRA